MSESKTYGVTETFGCTTYSCSGFPTMKDARMNVYRRAFENGDWSPPALREKWWQFWRPVEHDEIEAHFAAIARATGADQ